MMSSVTCSIAKSSSTLTTSWFYSDTLEDHVQHVRAVLQRLIQYQLFAKIEKCDFTRPLSHSWATSLAQEAWPWMRAKVKAVVEWPRPTTLKELQCFLGFANFYRRFIRGFSMVAEPLTALVRKGTSCLPWNEEATKAFSRLKQVFTSAPIPASSRSWVTFCRWSGRF